MPAPLMFAPIEFQEVREIDDVRLTRRVLDDRKAPGLDSCEDDIHRRADRHHIEINVGARSASAETSIIPSLSV